MSHYEMPEPHQLARKHSYNVAGINVTQRELSILYATKASQNAQTAHELAQRSRASLREASKAINGLIRKNIMKSIESFDNRFVFGFGESDLAQAVYCEIYQVPPIEE